jgi:hypothetical protein
MNIIAIKLNTGDELIAKISETANNTDTVWELHDVRTLMLTNEGRFSLGPIMFSANPEKPINVCLSSIATYSYDVEEGILSGYQSASSKIFIPSTRQILKG